jgi:hypothetical protein
MRNSISLTLVFIFLIYPSITKSCFEILNCINIDGVYYLRNNFDIICWDDYHKKMIFFIVIPVIIIWIVAFPLIILVLLRKHKNDLNSASILIKYGIFFIGLKD